MDDEDIEQLIESEDETCEGCGLPVYGEGRYTTDDVYLCGPCFDEVPVIGPRGIEDIN